MARNPPRSLELGENPPFFPVEEPWRSSARYDHGVTMEVICQIRPWGNRGGLYQGVTMELICQIRPWVPWMFHGVAMDELSARRGHGFHGCAGGVAMGVASGRCDHGYHGCYHGATMMRHLPDATMGTAIAAMGVSTRGLPWSSSARYDHGYHGCSMEWPWMCYLPDVNVDSM